MTQQFTNRLPQNSDRDEKYLFRKVVHGSFWTFIDLAVSKGIPLVVIIILARILGPKEFGLYGILVIFLSFGLLLTENGVTTSLIKHHKLSSIDYSTVFYINIILCVGIYIMVFVLSPFVAIFFDKPILTNLIRVISISFLLSSISAVHLAILNKKMRFKKLAILNMPGAFIGGLCGIFLANNHMGIWSLVYMTISVQVITSLLLWINIKWRPSLIYSVSKARLHFTFGINMLLSGFLDTLFKNSYNIIIGKFYPIQSLAFFERARSIQEYPSLAITGISNKVSYPLLASSQSNTSFSNSFFKKLIQVTFFINTPLMFVLAGIAQPLFLFILGKEWLSAVPYFQIFCLISIFYPHHAFNLNVLKVKGRSDLFLRLEVIKKLIMIFIIVLTAPFGIMSLMWGMLLGSVSVLYINSYYSGHFISYSFNQQIIDLIPTLIIGVVCFFITHYVATHFIHLMPYAMVMLSASLGLLVYVGLNFMFNKQELFHHLNTLSIR